MPRSPNDDLIEKRYIETVWLVFSRAAGKFTTEVYEEKAVARVQEFAKVYGHPVYVIRTDQIMRFDKDNKKRIYKLEAERLVVSQELI